MRFAFPHPAKVKINISTFLFHHNSLYLMSNVSLQGAQYNDLTKLPYGLTIKEE